MPLAPAHKSSIRLVIVDDHPLVRDGLRARLEAVPGMEVVGEVGNGIEALLLAERHTPDLMLVDIGMKDMNGIRLTEELSQHHPAISILILSMYDNAEFVSSTIRAGARGYVLKDAGSQEIITAIEAVSAGGTYYSRSLASALIEPAPIDGLTQREREVLIQLAQGLDTKASARRLGINKRTVESHRQKVRDKLGIKSPVELAKYVIKRGWIRE